MSNLKEGVDIKEEQSLSFPKKLKGSFLPKRVSLHLIQHTGKASTLLVEKDQILKAGDKIADPDGFISASLHSSISGKVSKVCNYSHPLLGKSIAVSIEGDGTDEEWKEVKKSKVEEKSPKELIDIIKDCGIVGLGGGAFPTHVKLNPPQDKKIETLIINGCECEPYLASDDILMQDKPFEIIKGIELVRKIVNPDRVIVVLESDKEEALIRMRQAALKKNIEVIKVDKIYPQGAEKQLIKSVISREVPPGGLPFDVGAIVLNVGTCFSIYEAVYKGKPLIERYLTLAGDAVSNPGVYSVRVGTLLKDVIEHSGGLTKELSKIIFGGPMMGITQASLDTPILKGTSGILLLSKRFVSDYKEYPCIRCSQCVDLCPMNLMPTKIAHFVKHGKWDLLDEYNISDCIECGSCSYICSSRIPLLDYIKLGKDYLKNNNIYGR
ncbi:MAG: electron transport complex subunit RsxC [Candidatus Kaelpia aquatica]|nr:electron transport complex subunit RsxC [Candidatus Kaelpia aquatica]